jgi:hypothetical protein
MKYFILLSIFLVACSNQYDQCIETEKVNYRKRNPNASYGQLMSKQSEFEMMCSSYKGK